ncbi:DUF1716-domain-containing protein [Exidia glandulosa HHB12029]|uniref:DUF1716-domain-containing protein n=1 Tax=Exidia glandulosa HHB12029 TaxID=1314781 RepID=A0A166BUU1_EXIGL|nr:DUF1716-domain-containing protein [Exidia glandulosa HHB12029]
MDIDKLFKVPKLPTGGNKRRMPDLPSAEVLKRMRLDAEGTSSVTTTTTTTTVKNVTTTRKATVEDVDEDEDMDVDTSRDSTEFAPGGDADYFTEEDDEGRFFGGGLTKEQKEILNIFEKAAGQDGVQDEGEMTPAHIRRLVLKFERAATKNQEQRAKHADDPAKFIDSEADLDSAIKALLPLAQAPARAYPELAKGGGAARLASLLSHENADIALDVVELIHELTDEDSGEDALDDDDEDEDQEYTREEALKLLVDTFLENSVLELLVQNLDRLNESEDADRQGVFQILGIFENMLSINPQLANELVARTSLMKWLLQRVEAKTYDENRGYAAEILAILLQDHTANRLQFGQLDGVEALLKVLSQYRKRDPADADETEFMENLFDVLCSALAEMEIKKLFLKSEGVDLMVLMMKEKMQSRSRSIKVLDHALSSPAGSANCEAFVEALGLKTLFPAFMGKHSSTGKKGTKEQQPAQEDTAHVLGILSSLLSNLASGTPARTRLLAKFVDAGYEKVDRLLELREGAENRLRVTERDIEQEKKQLEVAGEEVGQNEEDLWFIRRLEGGLFTLQTIDYILAWICMEDDGVRAHAQTLLARKSKTLKDVVKVLQGFLDSATDEADVVLDENGEPAPTQRMILTELVAFLDAC